MDGKNRNPDLRKGFYLDGTPFQREKKKKGYTKPPQGGGGGVCWFSKSNTFPKARDRRKHFSKEKGIGCKKIRNSETKDSRRKNQPEL